MIMMIIMIVIIMVMISIMTVIRSGHISICTVSAVFV